LLVLRADIFATSDFAGEEETERYAHPFEVLLKLCAITHIYMRTVVNVVHTIALETSSYKDIYQMLCDTKRDADVQELSIDVPQ